MAEPASWLLMELLAERIRGISLAGGYFSDLGTFPVVLDEDELPLDGLGTVLEATQIDVTRTTSERLDYDVTIVVEFAVPKRGGGNPKRLVHRGALDLARALLIKATELPLGVRTFEQGGAQLLTGEDADGAAYLIAQVTARAGLTETKSPGAT